jgi:Cu(I)/Ag(I) efflux system membrane fusion protein
MKKILNNIKDNYGLVLGVLVTGVFLGWLLFHSSGSGESSEPQLEQHEGHKHSSEDVTTWTCSMHPQIKQNEPGQCPICAMDLVPLSTVQTTESDVDSREIVFTASAVQLANIETAVVSRGIAQKSLFLQGKVHADERNMAELTARFGARIENLYVNFTGQHVQKGEKLATLYSPDLVTAQRELLEALSFKESRPNFYTAARAKLKLWDLTEDQINNIENRGEPELYFDILSPISGTVMMRFVSVGDYVREGSAMFRITDLSKVWVMLDAYESDLPWIKMGDRVELTVQSLPGKRFEGRVAYIDPFLDATTRVAKVRIELPNPGLALKPEMFARGILHSKLAADTEHLLVPKSSILWTGKRAVVYVRVPERELPTFLFREITLGPEAGDYYTVADGLREGELVAVNGVFKIDAAAQLEGKPSMMNPDGGQVSMGHDHGGGDRSAEQMDTGQESYHDEELAGEVAPAFKEQLQSVYNAYIPMKNALVKSDAGAVKAEAEKIQSSLQAVDMELVEGDLHMKWMSLLEILNSEISAIVDAEDLSVQRIAFAVFNDAFYNTVKLFGLQKGTVYYQYCPMANGDQGAFWLSEIDEIRNPYFGDEMLSCGETRETIEFND